MSPIQTLLLSFLFSFSVVRNDVIDDGPVLGRRFNLHSDGLLQLAQVDS